MCVCEPVCPAAPQQGSPSLRCGATCTFILSLQRHGSQERVIADAALGSGRVRWATRAETPSYQPNLLVTASKLCYLLTTYYYVVRSTLYDSVSCWLVVSPAQHAPRSQRARVEHDLHDGHRGEDVPEPMRECIRPELPSPLRLARPKEHPKGRADP